MAAILVRSGKRASVAFPDRAASVSDELELAADLTRLVLRRMDVGVAAALFQHLGLVVRQRAAPVRAGLAGPAERQHDRSGDPGLAEMDVRGDALPLRRAKVSVQRTEAERPLSSVTVAENTPAALAGAFGAGTSLFGVSVARYE